MANYVRSRSHNHQYEMIYLLNYDRMNLKSTFGGEPRMSIINQDGNIRYHVLSLYAIFLASFLSILTKLIESTTISNHISIYLGTFTTYMILLSWIISLGHDTLKFIHELMVLIKEGMPILKSIQVQVRTYRVKMNCLWIGSNKLFQTLRVIRC